MESTVRLAILGDRDAGRSVHSTLDDALRHAIGARHRTLVWEWIHTETLAIEPVSVLAGANGIVAATDDACANLDGALAGIRLARERHIPFLAVGGAFRHAVVEFARNVLGLALPSAATMVQEEALAAGGAGRRRSGAFFLDTDSRAAALYGRWRAVEEISATAALEPALRELLERGGLHVTGTSEAGEPTVLELQGHPMYIATQFEPQLASRPQAPAPLIRAIVDAAVRHREQRRGTPHGLAAIG